MDNLDEFVKYLEMGVSLKSDDWNDVFQTVKATPMLIFGSTGLFSVKDESPFFIEYPPFDVLNGVKVYDKINFCQCYDSQGDVMKVLMRNQEYKKQRTTKDPLDLKVFGNRIKLDIPYTMNLGNSLSSTIGIPGVTMSASPEVDSLTSTLYSKYLIDEIKNNVGALTESVMSKLKTLEGIEEDELSLMKYYNSEIKKGFDELKDMAYLDRHEILTKKKNQIIETLKKNKLGPFDVGLISSLDTAKLKDNPEIVLETLQGLFDLRERLDYFCGMSEMNRIIKCGESLDLSAKIDE